MGTITFRGVSGTLSGRDALGNAVEVHLEGATLTLRARGAPALGACMPMAPLRLAAVADVAWTEANAPLFMAIALAVAPDCAGPPAGDTSALESESEG